MNFLFSQCSVLCYLSDSFHPSLKATICIKCAFHGSELDAFLQNLMKVVETPYFLLNTAESRGWASVMERVPMLLLFVFPFFFVFWVILGSQMQPFSDCTQDSWLCLGNHMLELGLVMCKVSALFVLPYPPLACFVCFIVEVPPFPNFNFLTSVSVN